MDRWRRRWRWRLGHHAALARTAAVQRETELLLLPILAAGCSAALRAHDDAGGCARFDRHLPDHHSFRIVRECRGVVRVHPEHGTVVD